MYIQLQLTFTTTILAGNDGSDGFISGEGDYWGRSSIGIHSNNQLRAIRRVPKVILTLSSWRETRPAYILELERTVSKLLGLSSQIKNQLEILRQARLKKIA